MVLEAAQAGQGVALGWSYITDPMIADGRLVCPIDYQVETQDGYYLCASKEANKTSEVVAFLDWLSMEAKEIGDLRMIQEHTKHTE
jgi:DNA-binding transcriptional LysR family regulator